MYGCQILPLLRSLYDELLARDGRVERHCDEFDGGRRFSLIHTLQAMLNKATRRRRHESWLAHTGHIYTHDLDIDCVDDLTLHDLDDDSMDDLHNPTL